MLKLTILTAGPVLAAAVLGSAYGESAPDRASQDARDMLGIGNAVCKSRPDSPSKPSVALLLAKNELTPYGQLPGEEARKKAADQPPLWSDLGSLSYKITTGKPAAQQYFDQGLRFAYAFNHEEAARAFRMAQRLDPSCAMCYWGEALVLGPNINMPMVAEAIAPAVNASNKAKSLMKTASTREQALIRALAARYSEDPNIERAALDKAYADAMGKLARRYPNDQEIGVLYAEALMNLSPWDYWGAGGAKPKGRTKELVATLERVLKANPEHPGAIHYYIHTVEASTNPKRAEPYAEKLAALMPGAGHIVHMPAHIYFRVGRYKDSLATNQKAVAVDEAYIAQQKPQGIYPLAYYPHNVHFVLVSAQMAGDGKSVVDAATKLSGLVTDEAASEFPIAQPVRVAPYFAHAQFSEPDTILAMPAPAKNLPYVGGLWHYARGIAFAAKGDGKQASEEAAAIQTLVDGGDFSQLTAAGIPAREVLQIAYSVVSGRIAQSSGDLSSATRHFKNAVAVEDKLAYMEPSYWYYPVRQSLGAVLFQQGDLDGAEQAFRSSLVRVPNNSWALYGLSEVYKKRGDAKRAAATDELLAKAWAGDRSQLSMQKL
ncbi:tetratricopeptide repeat protein [Oxalobacteraceae bacterium R-40]|uniref:Tetratricopeptide repeat protein n=1 Tax=Keguizhuia sedimenti TaxID=3064264 RepID=A0ABU1BQP0_9BURK|nr:tetratricopeptide repeat protein [Oxalobacteraceae bacterium R-40]